MIPFRMAVTLERSVAGKSSYFDALIFMKTLVLVTSIRTLVAKTSGVEATLESALILFRKG
jgi:hypothetical protein